MCYRPPCTNYPLNIILVARCERIVGGHRDAEPHDRFYRGVDFVFVVWLRGRLLREDPQGQHSLPLAQEHPARTLRRTARLPRHAIQRWTRRQEKCECLYFLGSQIPGLIGRANYNTSQWASITPHKWPFITPNTPFLSAMDLFNTQPSKKFRNFSWSATFFEK